MAPTATSTTLRELLEGRFSELMRDLEDAIDAQVTSRVPAEVSRARRDMADQLNQVGRRLRQASSAHQIGAMLTDAATRFAAGAALLRIADGTAHGERIRGVPEERAAVFPQFTIPLERAAALAHAVTSRDPVTCVATSGEISAELAAFTSIAADARAFLYPIVVEGRVRAVLCAWGDAQGSALELITQLAAVVWERRPAAADLVNVTKAEPVASTKWDSLPPGERRLHLRAQRYARVQVAGIRLHEGSAVQAGRAARDLYQTLQKPIDAGREAFHKNFFTACASMVDYFHLELVRTLANDDPDLLGKDYPGPLV